MIPVKDGHNLPSKTRFFSRMSLIVAVIVLTHQLPYPFSEAYPASDQETFTGFFLRDPVAVHNHGASSTRKS